MPPRGRGGRRPSRASIGKASELMGPPPAPGTTNVHSTSQDVKPDAGGTEDPLSQKILGPEVKVMKERLIDSATIMAQMVNHHTDVHKVGVQRQAPYPPRALRESWLRQSELYEELIDTVEIQLRRALAAVEYQIEQEQEKFKLKAEAEELQRNATPSGSAGGGKARKQSLFIDIPRFDEMNIDPLTIHPDLSLPKIPEGEGGDTEMFDITLTEEPGSLLDPDDPLSRIPSGAVVPKDPGLLRPSRSSISLTSLNRHGLKLDLSTLTMDTLAEGKSALPADRASISALGGIGGGGGKGPASPVTLAPKSARPRSDFDPINAFLTSAVDIDINIEDLFGDSEMPFTDSAGGDRTVGGAGAAAAIESFLSSQINVKTEDVPIDLLGVANSHASTNDAAAQDKLFEELGFVEVKSDHVPAASTSAVGVNMTSDLSVLGGDNGMDMGIGPFEFPNPSGTTVPTNFDMMGLETQDSELQRMQLQQQQRQQFGLDLSLPASLGGVDTGGMGEGQDGSKILDQYQQLLDDNPVGGNGGEGAGELTDFNFLFGTEGDGSSTSAGDGGLNFNSLFGEATGSNNNGKSP